MLTAEMKLINFASSRRWNSCNFSSFIRKTLKCNSLLEEKIWSCRHVTMRSHIPKKVSHVSGTARGRWREASAEVWNFFSDDDGETRRLEISPQQQRTSHTILESSNVTRMGQSEQRDRMEIKKRRKKGNDLCEISVIIVWRRNF